MGERGREREKYNEQEKECVRKRGWAIRRWPCGRYVRIPVLAWEISQNVQKNVSICKNMPSMAPATVTGRPSRIPGTCIGSRLPPPALRIGLNRLFQLLCLHWRSLEAGAVWYTSQQLKKTIWSRAGGDGRVRLPPAALLRTWPRFGRFPGYEPTN